MQFKDNVGVPAEFQTSRCDAKSEANGAASASISLPKIVELGEIVALTAGSGRLYRDNNKDSERQ